MSRFNRIFGFAPMILIVASCASANEAGIDSGSGSNGSADASCGTLCDQDRDGVVDATDQCPNTPNGVLVNHIGCSDSQLMPMLEPTFPPFGLTWVHTGDLGKAGGLTWTYTGIERKDLFHIDWIICDDPATPCGVSLDGPIDVAAESWQFSAADSDLPGGKLVFTNATHIILADATTPALAGRLTLTIVDATDLPIPFADVTTLGVNPRLGRYGAEIKGTGYKVVALAEVQDTVTPTWTPYLDYYNAAPTPVAGGEAYTSFGASFYSE